jgi:hypothetical protein
MKKIILFLVILALLVPAAALAATEFSLGGFIKLNSAWDSVQNGTQPTGVVQRNNDALFHHGRFFMTAQESRFNFTIKGPKLWGATTTGFIEMDFDSASDPTVSGTNSYVPRMRHAMFRLNWPETELMFGQYFGMFSEYAPEVTGDSQFSGHGFINQRVPQIRLTQKFAGAWTVAGAIAKPYDPGATDVSFASANLPAGSTGTTLGLEGSSAETPQLQGKLAYEQDLWGKAPFYGRPRGFTAQVTGGWQRTRYRSNFAAAAFNTFGQNGFGSATVTQNGQEYLNPWMIQGTLFIPVLPTYSNNLAGSASLTAQYFIGQGVSFLGGGRDQDNSWFNFSGINAAGTAMYNRVLMQQFGGYLQAQYWFTNQWFLNATWGFIRDYGINSSTSGNAITATNTPGYMYAAGAGADQVKLWSEYALTVWYRPIEALKFGLQYSYERTDFLQNLNNPTAAGIPPASAGATNVGEAHRVQFVAQMFF